MSLEVQNLSFAYEKRPILKNVSFTADYGQFLSVLGANGAGKSTLFRCILGLTPPKQGVILIDGRDVAQMSLREQARKIAYIPQSHSPVFQYSVLEMVLMGTTSQLGRFSSPGMTQRNHAMEAMEHLGIVKLQDRNYCKLSGGERQLVLIARAMAQQAKVLIMDEPTASLDVGNRIRVMQTVKKLTKEGYAVIQSTHDPQQAYYYSDYILALDDGTVAAYGTPKETICTEVMQKLYGDCVSVRSLRDDELRVCLPTE